MEVGDLVRITGLKAKPEHNGKAARVVFFDEHKGRFTVRLRDDGEMLALRPANLVDLSAPSPPPAEAEEVSTDAMASEAAQRQREQAARDQRRECAQPRPPPFVAPPRAADPLAGRAMPSFLRERMAEHEANGLLDGSDSDEQAADEPTDVTLTHELRTLTLTKIGKLGMRITEAERADERGHALVDSVSEGPAKAAGVLAGDLIISVNGALIGGGGRAEATAKIQQAAFGIMALCVARRRAPGATQPGVPGVGGPGAASGLPAAGSGAPTMMQFGYDGVD